MNVLSSIQFIATHLWSFVWTLLAPSIVNVKMNSKGKMANVKVKRSMYQRNVDVDKLWIGY